MRYQNPVIRGFHPDPSICRVGEDYYTVSSTFEYAPGISLFHSRDLLNWEQIGNCLDGIEDIDLSAASDSGGVWAATIFHHDDQYYVTANVQEQGNFIIRTDDPEKGWSEPLWIDAGGIDPSLYFEDGRSYYLTNESNEAGKEMICLAEIDLKSGQLLGEMESIWHGTGGGFLEAPHLYKIKDYYYLLAAEGGTFSNHKASIARSRHLSGPYESCPDHPILTNAHDTSMEVRCSGHGDIFQDHKGNWWIIHLACRSARRTMTHLGRETFLTPLFWKDSWPYVKNNKMARLTENGAVLAEQKLHDRWEADFSKSDFTPQWRFLRNPVRENYKIKYGKLFIYPSVITLQDAANPSYAAVVQGDFDCEFRTHFRFRTKEEGDRAGLALYLSSDFYCFFGIIKEAEHDSLILFRKADDIKFTSVKIPFNYTDIHLRIKADKENYHFFYKTEGKEWQKAGSASSRFLSPEIAGKCFTGTTAGLYTACESDTSAVMEVFDFSMSCL